MKKLNGMILLTSVSCLMSCKLGSSTLDSSQDTALSAASTGSSALQEFCATAKSRMKGGVKTNNGDFKTKNGDFTTEIDYLCKPTQNQSGKTINLTELMKNSYTGEGAPQKAIEIIELSSKDKDTHFAFIGALKVKKNLAAINKVREKSLNISTVDTQFGVELSHKVVKQQNDCYEIKESVKDPLGGSELNLIECFYDIKDSTVISYQGLAPGEDQSKPNASIFVRFAVSPTETLLLVVTNKKVNNKGLGSIAEGVIRGQAPQLLSKYFEILSQAPEAETIPSALSLSEAKDFNQINVDEDWSWARTKLSCKPDTAIYALKQTEYSPTTPKALLQIDCGVSMKNEALNSYRYVEAPNKWLPDDEISCRDDEYAAGVSYHRYSDSTHILDGIKSLLCMKKKSKGSSCSERKSGKCEDGEYVKGVKLYRVGGFICDTSKRIDDHGRGCYRFESVTCCK